MSGYNQLINQADQYRDNDNFNDAKKVYNQAIKLKPLESYPKTQIEFINNKIDNISRDKIRSEYEEIIKKADLLFKDKSYKEALKKYDEANEISPNEPYPIDKIREIKKLLIKIESKDNEYQRLINQADNEFESANWDDALKNYQLAINIYNKEHPQKRIEEINLRLSELKSQNDAALSERSKFDDIIIEADQLYSQEKYAESKVKFQEALNLFKDEYYPKKKLAEIELILREIEVSNLQIEKYNDLISKADALRLENKLEEACQWCVELVISGYYEELWERIINYVAKYIGILNPLLPLNFLYIAPISDVPPNKRAKKPGSSALILYSELNLPSSPSKVFDTSR